MTHVCAPSTSPRSADDDVSTTVSYGLDAPRGRSGTPLERPWNAPFTLVRHQLDVRRHVLANQVDAEAQTNAPLGHTL